LKTLFPRHLTGTFFQKLRKRIGVEDIAINLPSERDDVHIPGRSGSNLRSEESGAARYDQVQGTDPPLSEKLAEKAERFVNNVSIHF
jgi:hypothetical protein